MREQALAAAAAAAERTRSLAAESASRAAGDKMAAEGRAVQLETTVRALQVSGQG